MLEILEIKYYKNKDIFQDLNNSKDYLNRSSSLIKQSRNSKNLYYNQIQWKKKVLLENEKRKEIKDNNAQSNCTFKPKIITKSIKYQIL